MNAPNTARRGVALLEVLVALVLVAIVVTAGVALAADATRAVGRVRERDVAMRRASAFLDAVALWPRADLDRHLGDRAEGVWTLHVERPIPTLYVVALTGRADTSRTDVERADARRPVNAAPAVVLATTLYRPVEP